MNNTSSNPGGGYSFQLTDEEKAQLCLVPLHEQATWLSSLAKRKRPLIVPAPPGEK